MRGASTDMTNMSESKLFNGARLHPHLPIPVEQMQRDGASRVKLPAVVSPQAARLGLLDRQANVCLDVSARINGTMPSGEPQLVVTTGRKNRPAVIGPVDLPARIYGDVLLVYKQFRDLYTWSRLAKPRLVIQKVGADRHQIGLVSSRTSLNGAVQTVDHRAEPDDWQLAAVLVSTAPMVATDHLRGAERARVEETFQRAYVARTRA